MWLKQFRLGSLECASGLIGAEEAGKAFMLDLRRGVEAYCAEARRQGVRIG